MTASHHRFGRFQLWPAQSGLLTDDRVAAVGWSWNQGLGWSDEQAISAALDEPAAARA